MTMKVSNDLIWGHLRQTKYTSEKYPGLRISNHSFIKYVPGTPVLFTLLYSENNTRFCNKPENAKNFIV